ncbi:hypothetical protein [Oceanirhabdus sp. W0125-5]|uniref:hypothetical protein n=1 Tax=Oceanirhabdus sp. W0125-5 TaxID=2999116 RepID=UPI0022F31CA5|nr:hypothetical protein [Oceanirhabdus sp. W0125-5]WBW96477.1 hypothetical protein OW730_22695 [Oceanirhabdus sp. W0125-5]
MDIPVWQYIISMGGYFALLILIVSFMRKHYKIANWIWIGALFTFPLWLRNVDGWFRWFKTLSVLVPTILVGFARISNYEERKGKGWEFLQKGWVMWTLYGVLFLNIMEATVKDYQMGNMLNALCGVILCITIPFPSKYWKISKGKASDLVVYTTIGWNLLYTTWNGCFVYAEAGAYFASSLCIIFAAEIYPIMKRRPELYVMSRVYTLATHILIRACFGGLFPSLMDASSWHNAEILKYWGIINGMICVPYAIWYAWQLHSGNADMKFMRLKEGISIQR